MLHDPKLLVLKEKHFLLFESFWIIMSSFLYQLFATIRITLNNQKLEKEKS